jgi:hypothetical protein
MHEIIAPENELQEAKKDQFLIKECELIYKQIGSVFAIESKYQNIPAVDSYWKPFCNHISYILNKPKNYGFR